MSERVKERQELAMKVSNLETPNLRNIIPSIVKTSKGRMEKNTESQQEQQSRTDKLVIEIRSQNITEPEPSRPNMPKRSVSFSQGLLISRISTDRWGTVTVPVPFLSRVDGR